MQIPDDNRFNGEMRCKGTWHHTLSKLITGNDNDVQLNEAESPNDKTEASTPMGVLALRRDHYS